MTVHVTAPMLAAYDHFISAGFIENGAGAAVGNFCQESGEFLIATMFRAHPDYSGGVPDALKSGGIAEWLGDRKTAYIAFAGRAETRLGLAKGSLLNDLGTQCDFVVYELQTTPKYATLYQQLTSGSRSIVNLTANFMMVYEVPALSTANLDNRIAHAEAVVAKARMLKAPQAPQPAPQAPIPQVPASRPQPPVLPIPQPPAGPIISASTAGRQLAVLDNLEAMRRAYLAEISAAQKELSIIETTIADFGKLASLPAPSILLPDPAPAINQGNHTMLGPNWQTSLSGIGALLGAAAGIFHSVSVGQMPDMTQIGILFAAVSAGVGLLQAKDKAVTGGTIPATPEAKKRVGVA